jgi:phosphoglycolate phosphatase
MNIRAILFDLDGTLVDTWKDLMNASNHVLNHYGFPPMNPAEARLLATDGIRAMLTSVMGEKLKDYSFEQLKDEFLEFYLKNINRSSEIFSGYSSLMQFLRKNSISWGIVTNKFRFLTEPLISCFPELSDCAVTVCNDTVPEKKPHPAPLLYALKTIGISAGHALYVGDHIRDVECGINAGTYTAAAAWGYIRKDDDPGKWGADIVVNSPEELIDFIKNT